MYPITVKYRLLKIFLSIVLLFLSLNSFSQTYTLSGYITDKATGEALIGASVYDEILLEGTTTNNYGFYSLSLPYGKRHVVISHTGYAAETDTFFMGSSIVFNKALEIEITLPGATITAKPATSVDKTDIGKIDIPISQIKKMPAILGEVDVIKAIQLLPGVKGGNEGSSGMYVRGGSPDQNLILLDGVPVYNVNHLFGFFSVFNSDAINSVQLYKGGFPARYGGRLSSVLDITMKEGNNKKIGGTFSISPIAGRLSLEGPIGKSGKTTFAVSGRRTFLDIITKPFFSKGNSFGYYFYDFNVKVCHTFSQKDKIFVSFYSGIDKFKITATDKDTQGGTTATDKSSVILKWGNQTGAFRWNHVISNKLVSNYTLNFTRFQFDVINTFEQTRQTDTTFDQAGLYLRYFSGIRDWAVKADYEYTPDARNKIRFGGSYINHGFAPGAAQLKFTGNGPGNLDTLLGPNGRIYTNEFAVYGEDERRITKRVKVNGGLRAVGYNVRGKTTFYLEPRFSLNKNFDGKFAIKAAYSMMNQFLHLLANSGTSLPTDLWVPATDKIKPQTSQQVSIGLNVPLKQAFEFTVEGYYKWMKNLIDYKEGASFAAINQSWEDKVLAGNGQSYGAEFLIQKKTGPLTGWIGYTLAWANRRIIGINNDKTYPFKYDRRHDVSLVSSYKYSEKYTFSASVVFSTGNAITFPIGQYLDINGNVVYEYGSKNGFRLNNNSRLDIGYTKMLDKKRNKRNLEQSWTFSIYNVLAHNNPYYVYVDNTTSPAKVKQISLFGFVPGIAYNLKF